MKQLLWTGFALACAAGDGGTPNEPPWCQVHRCEVAGVRILSPVPELLELTQTAAPRWSNATGLVVAVGEGGIPVVVNDNIWAENENKKLVQACGVTIQSTDGVNVEITQVQIDLDPPAGCPAPLQTILHELGHTMIVAYAHTKHGLLSPSTSQYNCSIDDAAVNLVCSTQPCTKFVPERYLRDPS